MGGPLCGFLRHFAACYTVIQPVIHPCLGLSLKEWKDAGRERIGMPHNSENAGRPQSSLQDAFRAGENHGSLFRREPSRIGRGYSETARHCKARRGIRGRGEARQGTTRQGAALRGVQRRPEAQRGTERRGKARRAQRGIRTAWVGEARRGLARRDVNCQWPNILQQAAAWVDTG